MIDDEFLTNLKNVLNDRFGFDVIYVLLKELGAFERGINRNFNDKELLLTLGKREKGTWLLDCIFKADSEKYIELLKENLKKKG